MTPHVIKQPIQPEVRETMNRLARTFDSALPDGYGFALLVFKYGESGFMNYISNSDRADMKKAFKEFLQHMEQEGN